MSWKIIHEIFGLAATDDDFAQELLANPVDTVEKRGYPLTEEEREAFQLSTADTLSLFSQQVLHHLTSFSSNE